MNTGVYVASRASIPKRSVMWREFRRSGALVNATWIDEAGAGETDDLVELWTRIENEISRSLALILYVEQEDFPLKGALVEVGLALGKGIPVYVVAPCVEIDEVSYRPLGSWVKHPLVKFFTAIELAYEEACKRFVEGK